MLSTLISLFVTVFVVVPIKLFVVLPVKALGGFLSCGGAAVGVLGKVVGAGVWLAVLPLKILALPFKLLC